MTIIGAAFAAYRTPGGRCNRAEAAAPRPVDLTAERATKLKATAIPVFPHYSTADRVWPD